MQNFVKKMIGVRFLCWQSNVFTLSETKAGDWKHDDRNSNDGGRWWEV